MKLSGYIARFSAAPVAALCIFCAGTSMMRGEVSVVDRPAASGVNRHYGGVRAPLAGVAFEKLPVGSTKPTGWLKRQLELQRDGLNGHLGEISYWLDKNNNAWLAEGGDKGWEEVPYWLRGYSNLAYILGDEKMLEETRIWLDAVFANQREDGYFGPVNIRNGHPEIWANMIMLWCMQAYYEYTGDRRALDLMGRFFRWELSLDDNDFLKDYWENCRGADNMWSVIWWYNRTGEEWVLPLIDKIHRNGADWAQETTLPNWHNVNIAQGFREPAEYYLLSGNMDMLHASYNDHNLVRRIFGQVPGGMFGADENARMGYIDPRQGTETCGFVEQILSDGIMYSITADPMWAEHCEDVAFNSFPASMMPDLKALRYITSPNQTISDSKNHRPSIDNSGPFMVMNPFSSRCCQHNHGLGWPSLAQYLLLATSDNGLATGVYAANATTAKVADGTMVTVKEVTEYPFEEKVRFEFEMKGKSRFPMYFRIPSWAEGSEAYLNGRKVDAVPVPGKYLRVDREWKNGDKVELFFPMQLTMRRWPTNKNSVSVNYGPLTLSLKIQERYEKADGRDAGQGDSHWQEGADHAAWPAFEIFPASDWNYSLVTYGDDPLKYFSIIRKGWPADNQPFTLDNVPLEFKAKGRRIPAWGYDQTGLCGVLPDEDAQRGDIEEITLVPMGAARLRVASFPASEE